MAGQNATHKAGPAELEADIARQREALASTVNELTEQVRRLDSLYGRRMDAGQVTPGQREVGDALSAETMSVLRTQRDALRPEEPGEWY